MTFCSPEFIRLGSGRRSVWLTLSCSTQLELFSLCLARWVPSFRYRRRFCRVTSGHKTATISIFIPPPILHIQSPIPVCSHSPSSGPLRELEISLDPSATQIAAPRRAPQDNPPYARLFDLYFSETELPYPKLGLPGWSHTPNEPVKATAFAIIEAKSLSPTA